MSKKKKKEELTVDRTAVMDIEKHIQALCQNVPNNLQPFFTRSTAIHLAYNRQAQVEIPIKNEVRRQSDDAIYRWLEELLRPIVIAWKKFRIDFRPVHHGSKFIVYLSQK